MKRNWTPDEQIVILKQRVADLGVLASQRWDELKVKTQALHEKTATVERLEWELLNRDIAAGNYRAALRVLVDKTTVIHDVDLRRNLGKKIYFDRDEARRCFTIRVVDEKPTTETP